MSCRSRPADNAGMAGAGNLQPGTKWDTPVTQPVTATLRWTHGRGGGELVQTEASRGVQTADPTIFGPRQSAVRTLRSSAKGPHPQAYAVQDPLSVLESTLRISLLQRLNGLLQTKVQISLLLISPADTGIRLHGLCSLFTVCYWSSAC